MGTLIAAPADSLPFLKTKISPVEAVDAKRLQQLLADLGSDQFTVRDKASRELQKLGRSAEPWLRRAQATKPSVEVRQRVGRLLQKLKELPPLELRTIEVLEYIGSPQARTLLGTLAEGEREALLTQEAITALKRLKRR
jgi:hypothetical protein